MLSPNELGNKYGPGCTIMKKFGYEGNDALRAGSLLTTVKPYEETHPGAGNGFQHALATSKHKRKTHDEGLPRGVVSVSTPITMAPTFGIHILKKTWGKQVTLANKKGDIPAAHK